MNEIFISEFTNELINACFQFRPIIFDMDSGLPLKKNLIASLKNFVRKWMSQSNMVKRRFSLESAENLIQKLCDHYDELSMVYDLLSDDYSRKTFIQVLVFRVLGPGHVTLPPSWKEYIESYNKIANYQKRRSVEKQGIWTFNEYSVKGTHGQLSLVVPNGSILTIFLVEQYAYRKGPFKIEIESGDTVIDGGACWGDVAIYSADIAGTDGHVYSFEFVKENLRYLRRNLDLNPDLKDRVTILERALHSTSGKHLDFSGSGPGSSIQEHTNVHSSQTVESCGLDDLVERENLKTIDFIKLDIEGSELACLKGAEESIRRFKPKLAIAVYHKIEDFWELPLFIHGLNPAYRLCFDHFAPNVWESMLFAKCV